MRRDVTWNGASRSVHHVAVVVFVSSLVSACVTQAPVNAPAATADAPLERAAAEPLEVEAPAPPCVHPPYRVRDLTVPWTQRTYLVAPCAKRWASPSAATPMEAITP